MPAPRGLVSGVRTASPHCAARRCAQVGEQRHFLPSQGLLWQIQAKTHGQADFGGAVLVKALHAAKAGVFADQFQCGEGHEYQI
jgi:hypothetical protein